MLARHAIRTTAALVAALAVAACGGNDNVEATEDAVLAGADSMVAASPLGGNAQMSDANILSMLAVANANEIATSELAQQKARNANVKSFARQMITDHRAMQGEADQLATRVNLQPQPGPAADSAQRAGAAVTDSLRALSGADFDRAYMAAQVRAHQNSLNSLQQFSGMAQNAELRTLLQSATQKVQQHLDRATQLQGQLGGGTTASAGTRTGTAAGQTGGSGSATHTNH